MRVIIRKDEVVRTVVEEALLQRLILDREGGKLARFARQHLLYVAELIHEDVGFEDDVLVDPRPVAGHVGKRQEHHGVLCHVRRHADRQVA